MRFQAGDTTVAATVVAAGFINGTSEMDLAGGGGGGGVRKTPTSTEEPPRRGHFRPVASVPCREVVPISEVRLYFSCRSHNNLNI